MPRNKSGDSAIHEELLDALKCVPVFANAGRDELESLINHSHRKTIARGEHLIHSGDSAEALYIVLRGKFFVFSNGRPIAEIEPGEPVGELGFFASRKRTADVVAARESEVLELSRDSYDNLIVKMPGLASAIMSSMAARLADNTSNSGKLRPRPGRTIAMIAHDGRAMPEELIQRLKDAVARTSSNSQTSLRIHVESDLPAGVSGDPAKITKWISESLPTGGKSSAKTLFMGNADGDSAWNRAILDNADSVFVTAEKALARRGSVSLSEIEQRVQHHLLKSSVQLIIWRDRHDRPIRNTANWLNGRAVQLHHHLALDADDDFDRIVRFITGTAKGLVLCGGGAFGTAHLGAIKAMKEAGLVIDMYGGTSVGAAMAAALAVGKPPDEVMDLCEDIFIRSKAMGRLTVPLHSVIDHKRFDEQMRKHYGEYRVEDLPHNFFSVATSLTKNDLHIIREGELWKAVRASSSIPAVFPPVIRDDGEVLIDGALVDNVPIDVMRDLKAGPNIVLNFKRGDPWRVNSDYEKLPGRMEAARRAMMRRKGDQRFPSIFSVLSRTMVITARRLLDSTDMQDDVLLEIPTLPKMGFLEWKRGREQFNSAYEAMAKALANGDPCADMMTRAQLAGNYLTTMNETELKI